MTVDHDSWVGIKKVLFFVCAILVLIQFQLLQQAHITKHPDFSEESSSPGGRPAAVTAAVVVAGAQAKVVSSPLTIYNHTTTTESSSSSSSLGVGVGIVFINDTQEDNQQPIIITPLEPPKGTKGKSLLAWSKQLKTPYLISSSLYASGHFHTIGHSMAKVYSDQPILKFCSFQKLVRIEEIKSNQRRRRRQQQEQNENNNNNESDIYIYQGSAIEGMFYNKVPKAASSTLAAVNYRIALRQGARILLNNNNNSNNNTTINTVVGNESFATTLTAIAPELETESCTHTEGHIIGAYRYYGNRNVQKSFLWGSIRDPASRALSRVFFYQLSKVGRDPNDETILYFLKNSFNPQSGSISAGTGGFQAQYLAMDGNNDNDNNNNSNNGIDDWFTNSKSYPTIVQRPDVLQERVRRIMESYDFLAVTERMDESLVVLQLLLNIPVGDILTTSSKISGAYTDQKKKDGTIKCIAIMKTFQSQAVREYLESDEWYALNYADYILYAAANKSLDLTIDRLGRDRVDKALQEFRHAKAIIDTECKDKVFPPCSANGTAQLILSKKNCYKADVGCGYNCIDEISLLHGW